MIKKYQEFLKESSKIKESEYNSIHIKNIEDVDHTRVVKFMKEALNDDYTIKKSGNNLIIDVSDMNGIDVEMLIVYLESLDLDFEVE